MRGLLYGILLQWKLDLRNKEVLLTYYIVPLIFFAFMGGIFTSINPPSKETLIQSMSIFGITMGAFLGSPSPLVELYSSNIKKAYIVGGIPLWVPILNNFISAFIHLYIMSTIIYILAPIIFGAYYPSSYFVYFPMMAIFITTCLSVGSVLGLLINKPGKLTLFAQLLFLPSVMLSGIMFPRDLLPEVLQHVSKLFPATWGYMSLQNNNFQLTLILPLLTIMTLALFIVCWRIYKFKME